MDSRVTMRSTKTNPGAIMKTSLPFFKWCLIAMTLTCQQAFATSKNPAMRFVVIPRGEFVMGSPESELRHENENQSRVMISAFEMKTTEVTQREWIAVMGTNPANFASAPYCRPISVNGSKICADHPVENVTWNEVQDFISRLNGRDKNYSYRLPTEAEWEYAARAGSTTAYSFGDDAVQLNDNAWFEENVLKVNAESDGQTRKVGMKKANAFGLHDMHGNVWEWVSDFFADPRPTTEPIDPKGPVSGTDRVTRGGSYNCPPLYLRSANRNYEGPDEREIDLGFRLVRQRKN